MANAEQLALIKKGVKDWNGCRDVEPGVAIDLIRADLGLANLAKANLVGANLIEANLRGANLREANLAAADLSGANLVEANLIGANLNETNLLGVDLRWANLGEASLVRARVHAANLGWANLRGADLSGAFLRANLSGSDLSRTDLEGVNISNVGFGGTILGDVDLSAVGGLRRVGHDGPSTIGVDTILKSGGKIPDEFLRGCGVDPLIQKILIGDAASKSDAFYNWIARRHNPLQRCFISYATKDKLFVDHLQKALNERGVDYWYAPEHGRWGEELHRQIDLEISLRDRMLLVCSEESLKKDWVAYEIERAIAQEEKRGSRVIFPIMIDGALLTWIHPRATRIRGVLAADFRKATKGKSFEAQLPKLLGALGYSDSTDQSL